MVIMTSLFENMYSGKAKYCNSCQHSRPIVEDIIICENTESDHYGHALVDDHPVCNPEHYEGK